MGRAKSTPVSPTRPSKHKARREHTNNAGALERGGSEDRGFIHRSNNKNNPSKKNINNAGTSNTTSSSRKNTDPNTTKGINRDVPSGTEEKTNKAEKEASKRGTTLQQSPAIAAIIVAPEETEARGDADSSEKAIPTPDNADSTKPAPTAGEAPKGKEVSPVGSQPPKPGVPGAHLHVPTAGALSGSDSSPSPSQSQAPARSAELGRAKSDTGPPPPGTSDASAETRQSSKQDSKSKPIRRRILASEATRLCSVIQPTEVLQAGKATVKRDIEFLSSGATVDLGNLSVDRETSGSGYDDSRESQAVPSRVHIVLPKLLNDVQIPVYEDEASSVIAYTLASQEHAAVIQTPNPNTAPTPSPDTAGGAKNASPASAVGAGKPPSARVSPATSSKQLDKKSSPIATSAQKSSSSAPGTTGTPGVGGIASGGAGGGARGKPDIFSPSWYYTDPSSVEAILNGESRTTVQHVFSDLPKSGPFNTNPSTVTRFTCKVPYARKFHALRQVFCGGEAQFIRSLSRCIGWNATGGKSGSTFARTRCGRYIIKFVNKSEFKMLEDLAGPYFKFMAKACFRKLPTVLSKILGCYQVQWKRANGDCIKTQYAIVMPNVFYDTPVTHIFDLKGSVRNRYVKTKPGESDRVLLDENFLEYTRGFPVPVEEKTKDEMRHAIRNDSKFLCDMGVVDYSLLVGLNESNRIIALGIIDYVRQYTWERRIETGVKSMGMITGKASPTVISPENYKVRFQLATERYFMMAPCQTSRAGLAQLPPSLLKSKVYGHPKFGPRSVAISARPERSKKGRRGGTKSKTVGARATAMEDVKEKNRAKNIGGSVNGSRGAK